MFGRDEVRKLVGGRAECDDEREVEEQLERRRHPIRRELVAPRHLPQPECARTILRRSGHAITMSDDKVRLRLANIFAAAGRRSTARGQDAAAVALIDSSECTSACTCTEVKIASGPVGATPVNGAS
jgi:hypothetical protein